MIEQRPPDLHFCDTCGKPAAFGFLVGENRFAWYCDDHRADGERRLVRR